MIVVVAVALLDADGRVLMQRRPDGRQHGGLWEFPGGKVEQGETPHAAACREIDEELGLALAPDDLDTVGFACEAPAVAGPKGPVVILLFACRRWTGAARALDAQAIDWVPCTAVQGLAMPPLDYPLARALERWLAATEGA